MQALQELYQETEKAHSSLIKTSKESEERIGQLSSEKKMLEEKLETLESSMIGDDKVEVWQTIVVAACMDVVMSSTCAREAEVEGSRETDP